MEKLNEIINKVEDKNNLKQYLAIYTVQYKVPVNDFDWDYRQNKEEYFFDAKNEQSAVYIAKSPLEKFNEGEYLNEIKMPNGMEKIELTGLMEIASSNLISKSISNTELKNKNRVE
jgi:hypothetical protein